MKVFIGSDHHGFDMKVLLSNFLKTFEHEIEDLGPTELNTEDDYPDFAFRVAQEVVRTSGSFGIVICASGAGMEIAANKVKGIRCCTGLSAEQVKAARQDDDINCLALAADFISDNEAREMALAFLETGFSKEEKHIRRLEKIYQFENTRF